ncbi:hypothetical protein GE21DRAFT_1218788, partial [Neurospora crassa]
ILRILKRRNFAGKNGPFNVRCHPAVRSTSFGFLGIGRFGVGVSRLSPYNTGRFSW